MSFTIADSQAWL